MKHPSDEFYERCGIEALKTLIQVIDPGNMTPESWARFVGDVFDLTDAISTELVTRLERNRAFREKDPEWVRTNAAPAASG